MHGGYRWLTSGTAIISALLIVSCENDSPAQPTPLPPLPPPPVSLARVDIRAPVSIDLQQSAQLTATAVRSDGSSEDVTGQAQLRFRLSHLRNATEVTGIETFSRLLTCDCR